MKTFVTDAASQRFVRRTILMKTERRINFRQIDRDAITVVTSSAASRKTPMMSKIYLRLVNAETKYYEREGVLRFTGGEREGKRQTAWEQLLELLDVASATAIKALTFMHQEGVIGYDAHKNGVGIRIFLNRAVASISTAVQTQKNLPAVHTSSDARRTSNSDAPSNACFAKRELLETDINSRAPKNGAKQDSREMDFPNACPAETTRSATHQPPAAQTQRSESTLNFTEVVFQRLKNELEICVRDAATQAARREHSQTRVWFETKALPKAVRVAQKESYNLLRRYENISSAQERARIDFRVGSNATPYGTDEKKTAPKRPCTSEELKELAETCLAVFETHGKDIETTLAELSSSGANGWLSSEDAAKIKELAWSLSGKEHGGC